MSRLTRRTTYPRTRWPRRESFATKAGSVATCSSVTIQISCGAVSVGPDCCTTGVSFVTSWWGRTNIYTTHPIACQIEFICLTQSPLLISLNPPSIWINLHFHSFPMQVRYNSIMHEHILNVLLLLSWATIREADQQWVRRKLIGHHFPAHQMWIKKEPLNMNRYNSKNPLVFLTVCSSPYFGVEYRIAVLGFGGRILFKQSGIVNGIFNETLLKEGILRKLHE